jgi:excisionase family DNA binding protein
MSTYVRPGQAADQLGVTVDSVSRFFDEGLLTGIKTPGGQRRIERESLEALKGLTTRSTSSEVK